jgi:quinoprotein glucose dehydrogenase
LGLLLLIGLPVQSGQDLTQGRTAYERSCAACHGDRGQGRLAPALVPFTRSFEDLRRIVRTGAGNGMMAPFSVADVSDADVRAIEQYLRSVKPEAAAGAEPSAERRAPVTFGSSAVPTFTRGPAAARAAGANRLVEWPFVGADQRNTRYSPLEDTTADNVGELDVVWRWRPEERPLPQFGTVPGNFTATPIMIDNVVYVTTNYNRVAALDAETGAVKWVYDPRAYEGGMPLLAGGFRHRGVAAWRDSRDGDKLRIFLASRYRLYSLDAETGQPVRSFGLNGIVDTSRDLSWAIEASHFEINAAPTIYKDLVILGSSIGDNLLYRRTPPGDVRAYHARTGKLVWRWSSIPQSPRDVGADTWENESWRDAGQIETWPGVTVDERRGLVYLPTGNPGNLYYGGARPGDNLFAETLIALDVETGRRKWHYQIVRHGVWDYSLPTQAMLTDLVVGGRKIEAVTQLTKHGFVFVFDRVSGQPVWPIENRPVPQSDVPGERSAATQPFPTRPPPVSPQGVSLDDAFDLTPELQKAARAEMLKYKIGPLSAVAPRPRRRS